MVNIMSRRVAAALAGASLVFAASGCTNSSSGKSSAATGDVQFWTLQDPTNTVQKAQVSAFNATGQGKVTMSVIATNGYKDKVRTAMGSSAMPGMFFNWGGGSLNDYVAAGKLETLDPSLKSHFLPSALQAGTIDGKFVGVPSRGTQPVFIFFNKQVFADAGVQPPKTWDDLLNLVKVFKSKGITPFAISGTGDSDWTEMLFLEYLVDREAGPDVFNKILAGDWSQWGNPAVLKAAEMVQQLVSAGAFGSSYSSVEYGAGGTSTLLAKGKAAMEVMGSWEYALEQSIDPTFTKQNLGYIPFVSVAGGKGDPTDVIGNPTNYISVTPAAPQQTATAFLKTTYSDSYVEGLVKMGEVPVTTNAKSMLSESPNPTYSNFVYDLVANAPSFTQSWDQALGPTLATPLVTEIQKLFNGQDTPQQFISNVLAVKS